MIRILIFSGAIISGLTWVSQTFASVTPGRPEPTSLSAPVRPLSEIKEAKEKKPNFDRDLVFLADLERRYAGRPGQAPRTSIRVTIPEKGQPKIRREVQPEARPQLRSSYPTVKLKPNHKQAKTKLKPAKKHAAPKLAKNAKKGRVAKRATGHAAPRI